MLGSEQDFVATSTGACNMSKYTTYIYCYKILNISVDVPNIVHSDHIILNFSKHIQHNSIYLTLQAIYPMIQGTLYIVQAT
jgi:hypothetical protein